MKLVYSNENNFIVNNVKNLIEVQGIKTFLKNEFAQGAVGEVSAFDVWPEIWIVDDADFERAQLIVKSSQGNDNVDWVCQSCSETNASSFELCWNCQHENTKSI
jgi:hypothetical protein